MHVLKKLRKQIAIENANAAPRGRNPRQAHQATQADRNGKEARHQPLRRSNSRGHASRRPRTHTQRHPVGRTLSPSTAEGNKLGCETQVRRLRTAGRCGLLTAYSCGSTKEPSLKIGCDGTSHPSAGGTHRRKQLYKPHSGPQELVLVDSIGRLQQEATNSSRLRGKGSLSIALPHSAQRQTAHSSSTNSHSPSSRGSALSGVVRLCSTEGVVSDKLPRQRRRLT